MLPTYVSVKVGAAYLSGILDHEGAAHEKGGVYHL